MKPLISEVALKARIAELGTEIDRRFAGEPYTMLVLMNGAMLFGADLLRALHGEVCLDSLSVSSYCKDRSSGELHFRGRMKLPVAGKNILLTDDIFDTGLTLAKLHDFLLEQGAKQVVSCVLLNKKVPKKTDYRPDFVGFEIEPCYVIGYGFDSEERYRNLPDIMTV